MRKLASIKTITRIHPIEGKDRIVLAIVDGWSVIVQKDQFAEGDRCIFVEPDSVLPERPEFEFLRKNNFRIKTMKMAGVISQGICFSLDILPQTKKGTYAVDDDVTDLLGIKQYERTADKEPKDSAQTKKRRYPKFLMRMRWFRKLINRKGGGGREFPSFLKKTDETRIQNMPFILKDKSKWIATEKIDGQSGTFCLVRHKARLPFQKERFEFIVCSRNVRLWKKDNSSYWRVADRYKLQDKLKGLLGTNDWVAIQGECVAPNVQGNKYKVSEADLYVFNLLYPTGRMPSLAAKEICEDCGLKFVPVLTDEYTLPESVDEVLCWAHGKSQIGDTLREGVVFRSADGKQSFKAVDPLFLIQYDE